MSFGEAKRLMRLVNVEALKARLGSEGKEAISYDDLIEACQSIGVARSKEEAAAFARVLDEAGVILLFRDKVLLHPDRVVDLVRKAVPLALTPENDPVWEELKKMQKKKVEIDLLAHKHVRRVLWGGLGLITSQLPSFSDDILGLLMGCSRTTCIIHHNGLHWRRLCVLFGHLKRSNLPRLDEAAFPQEAEETH